MLFLQDADRSHRCRAPVPAIRVRGLQPQPHKWKFKWIRQCKMKSHLSSYRLLYWRFAEDLCSLKPSRTLGMLVIGSLRGAKVSKALYCLKRCSIKLRHSRYLSAADAGLLGHVYPRRLPSEGFAISKGSSSQGSEKLYNMQGSITQWELFDGGPLFSVHSSTTATVLDVEPLSLEPKS